MNNLYNALIAGLTVFVTLTASNLLRLLVALDASQRGWWGAWCVLFSLGFLASSVYFIYYSLRVLGQIFSSLFDRLGDPSLYATTHNCPSDSRNDQESPPV